MGKLNIDKPYPKQIQFLNSTRKRIAFGGARGGGKSFALRLKLVLLALKQNGIQILLLRRTFPELRENHIIPLQKMLLNIAKYKTQDRVFEFANGSRIVLGYCKNEADVLQYQGQGYDVIALDEATQFSEFQYQSLTESNRTSAIISVRFEPRMYFTCNPGGVGHEWVKRLFVDRKYINKERAEDYDFIRSSVYDNKFLLDYSPDYVRALENLPEQRRKAMLDGNWDVYEGQYFTEFTRDIHVVQPFEIPSHWDVYTTMDYGLDMLAHYYIAVDEQGFYYVINEIYESDLIVSSAVDVIKDVERHIKNKIKRRFAPTDLWNTQSSSGKSTAYLFDDNGLYLTKSDRARLDGWLAVHEMMKIIKDVDGKPTSKLKIFSTCHNLIRTLPALQHDTKKIGDVATEPHELTHAPDALRYFCINYIRNTKPIKKVVHEYNRPTKKGEIIV